MSIIKLAIANIEEYISLQLIIITELPMILVTKLAKAFYISQGYSITTDGEHNSNNLDIKE